MELSRETMKKLMLLIAFAALAFTAFQWIDGVTVALRFLVKLLFPFLLGAAVAFILNVPMRFIERGLFPPAKSGNKRRFHLPAGLCRVLSLLLTFVLVAVILLVLGLVIAPQLAETISGLGVTIQDAFNRFLTWSEVQFANNPQIVQWLDELTIDWQSIDWKGLFASVADFLFAGAGGMLSSTISAAKSLVSGVTTTFISFVFACYLLLQKEKLSVQFRKALYALAPKRAADRTVAVCSLSHRVFSSFITGQCMEAVILGFMFFVTMTVLRMPYALLVGCLIAVTALIPIVGAFIGCVVGAFLLLMVSPMQALIFVVMFLVLQQVEGNLIYPHVVGSSVGLPSIWVLVAVTLGGNLMGITGMLIFIPLVSVVYTLFREFVYKRLKEKGLKIT